jgi:hypothetical protein
MGASMRMGAIPVPTGNDVLTGPTVGTTVAGVYGYGRGNAKGRRLVTPGTGIDRVEGVRSTGGACGGACTGGA